MSNSFIVNKLRTSSVKPDSNEFIKIVDGNDFNVWEAISNLISLYREIVKTPEIKFGHLCNMVVYINHHWRINNPKETINTKPLYIWLEV